MSSQNTHETPQLSELQRDYRRDWHQFTIEVESLRLAMNQVEMNQASVDDDSVAQARERVEIAATRYRGARNSLAVYLLQHDPHTDVAREQEECVLASPAPRSQAA